VLIIFFRKKKIQFGGFKSLAIFPKFKHFLVKKKNTKKNFQFFLGRQIGENLPPPQKKKEKTLLIIGRYFFVLNLLLTVGDKLGLKIAVK
jgi:hypothetical protein